MVPITPRGLKQHRGFTLVELLMAVAVLMILSSAAWRVITNDMERAKLNGVSHDLASWIESIRKAAQRTQGGCEITLVNLTNASDGTQLASVRKLQDSDSPCSIRPSFRFGATSTSEQLSSHATTSVFVFTPRGTLLGADGQALPNQVEIRLALRSHATMRCIRLSGLLGALQVGSHGTANVQTPCTAYSRF